jgi:hypothetical protein
VQGADQDEEVRMDDVLRDALFYLKWAELFTKNELEKVEFCGDVPRIELFARQHAEGWDCWGDEV